MGTPHIILITTDELRKDNLSCYGNQIFKTPNLDQLASRSIQFEQAYTTSPWCLPSRCAILTGQLPHRNGSYSNFRDLKPDPRNPNLFNRLQSAGYQTSVFGKCHFTPVPYSSTRPDATLPYEEFRDYYLSLGIDHLDLQDDKQVSVWFSDDYSRELDQAGYLEAYRKATWDRSRSKVFPFPGPEEWHPDSWVGRKAEEYIRGYDEEKPLFAWISFSGPHYPFDAPEKYVKRVDMSKDTKRIMSAGEFDDERRIHHISYHGQGGIDGAGNAPGRACKNYSDEYWHELRKQYYANVVQIDEYIGRILQAIDQKFGDDVLIIFTADHGEMLGNHGLWGKGHCAYQDVLNVPLLVKYPGEKSHLLAVEKVMLTDVTATCLQAAQIPLEQGELDGRDLKEILESGGYPYVVSEGEQFVTVFDGRYKYVHTIKNNQLYYELFDLQMDPNECQNVADEAAYASILAEMRSLVMATWMKDLLA